MTLIDSHCHLEDERFAQDLDDVISRMKGAGVTRALLAGSGMATSRRIADMVSTRDMLFGAVGVHPHEASDFAEADLDGIEAMLKLPRIVAIGEIGLDYHYDFSPRDAQRAAFVSQLEKAYEMNVPAVFHVREAHGDMLELLSARRGRLPRGVMHCYSGSVESAKRYLDMGFYLSFAGPVTFGNAGKALDVARYCPADRLLVETDSPYLAPVPHRGKRNEPMYVTYVAEAVAGARGIAPEVLARTATENAERLFGMKAS